MRYTKLSLSCAAIALAAPAFSRDQIQITGSSTVLPYATIVAEAFGENTDFPTPAVGSGGSSAGLKQFCEGVGENSVDIANSSRKIKDSEIEACAKAGVNEIIEVRIGYDGIVFASDINGPGFAFTPKDWFLALSDQVLVDGKLVANPNTKWGEVNPELPDQAIIAYIPGTKHGTREVFEDKVILKGCEESGTYDALLAEAEGADDKAKEKAAEKACITLRTDGLSVDIDGDYTETLTSIDANPNGIGVFGLSFYENNTDKLQAATMSGASASSDTIISGEYPVSRPLFFYIKKAHIGMIPGLKEYAEFFMSDAIAGEGGPLAQYGLVVDSELAKTQAMIAEEKPM